MEPNDALVTLISVVNVNSKYILIILLHIKVRQKEAV